MNINTCYGSGVPVPLTQGANNQSSAINNQFEKAILSEKDLKHACLKDAVLDFDINDKLY